MKTIIFIFGFIITAGVLCSQEVISSSGGTVSAGGYEVSWTLGEPVIETFTGTNNILTQGFHQTRLTATALDEIRFPGLELTVYPNPTSYILNIRSTGRDDLKLQYRFFDMDGKLLFMNEMDKNPEELGLLPFAGGNYLLRVETTNGDPIQTFKIVKN